MSLVLLHTSPVHIPVFDALRDARHPGLDLRHRVYEDLLGRAGALGPDAVADEVGAVIEEAFATGADAVLCTCSTLGGIAEAAGVRLGRPVVRVDRPMAAEAVRARRITVLVAHPATVEPTGALLAEEAHRAGAEGAEVRTLVVEGAWDRFEAGDRDGYLDRVAAAADTVTDADVIVLAQVSMAGAADRASTRIPVLTSPRAGLDAAAAVGH